MEASALAIGETPRRAFLTIGRLNLAAFAIAPRAPLPRPVRSIPSPIRKGLPDVAFIEARPPFDARPRRALMRDHRIDVLVTKNSGGVAAHAKLDAARAPRPAGDPGAASTCRRRDARRRRALRAIHAHGRIRPARV